MRLWASIFQIVTLMIMLVVGNLGKDSPSDSNLVFIYHPNAINYHAEVLGHITGQMIPLDSWRTAYEKLAFESKIYVQTALSEIYENEILVLNLSGAQGWMDNGTCVFEGHCGISSIDAGSTDLHFQRSVRRMLSIHEIPQWFGSEIE